MSSNRDKQSLRIILRTAWLGLCAFAFLVSLIAFLLVSYLDYKKGIELKREELVTQSYTVERRVSSELLAEKTSVADSVVRDLTTMYGLKSIHIEPNNLCSDPVCSSAGQGLIIVGRKLSVVSPAGQYLVLEKKIETFIESLRLKYFMAVFLPILCLFLMGIWYQHSLLNRNLLAPIQALVGQSYRGEAVPSSWPNEFVELSDKLEIAFRERDQAMIGQMASGVLHDIKTLLHSISVSTELASEVKSDASVFPRKLEALFKVCSIQIPKMKAVIETVLDGNRDIVINKQTSDIQATLNSVLESSLELARARGVSVESNSDCFDFVHDHAQLERALLNIVKNGLEAIDPKNPVKVVRLTSKLQNDAVEICVEDSGSGLQLEPTRIFKGIKTTKVHGTGLGLLISRKIVEAHGGIIIASASQALGGAQIMISIPNRSEMTRGMV